MYKHEVSFKSYFPWRATNATGNKFIFSLRSPLEWQHFNELGGFGGTFEWVWVHFDFIWGSRLHVVLDDFERCKKYATLTATEVSDRNSRADSILASR